MVNFRLLVPVAVFSIQRFAPFGLFPFNVLSVDVFTLGAFYFDVCRLNMSVPSGFFYEKRTTYRILWHHLPYDFEFEDGSRVWAPAKSRHFSSITQIIPANTNERSCACLLNYTYDYQNYFPGGCRGGGHITLHHKMVRHKTVHHLTVRNNRTVCYRTVCYVTVNHIPVQRYKTVHGTKRFVTKRYSYILYL